MQRIEKKQMREICKDYAFLIFAGLLYAVALKYFVLPSKIILTGTEGIASSLSYYFDHYYLFIWLYLIFQTLLIAFAFAKVSPVFARRSFVVVLTVVISLSIFPTFQVAKPEPENERIILVIFGGILAGVAKAISFKVRGSTGDEDILAAYFAMKYLKPVGIIGIIAGVISTTFGLGLDLLKTGQFETVINTLMYTSIYIFIVAETLNNLYRKFKLTMLVILTSDPDSVGRTIKEALPHRTYTIQTGLGGQSGETYNIVRTILTHEELDKTIDAVEKVDANCFYYHHDIEGTSRRYYIAPIG